MSPYDDGWLLENLHAELVFNHPQRVSVPVGWLPMVTGMFFGLVCSGCHVILKKDYEAIEKPPSELAYAHFAAEISPRFACVGSDKPAEWRRVGYDE